MKQVFPKEIIDNTAMVYQFKHSKRSKIIYLVILITLLAAVGSLPFLKVDVYSSARGIVKPNKERASLFSINSGQIVYNKLTNNTKVKRGDTLLVINNNGIDDRLNLTKYQQEETTLFINDLLILLENKNIKHKTLKSSKYQREYLQYSQKLRELHTRFSKMEIDYNRNKILFAKGVVARVEFEDKRFNYDLALSDIGQFKKQQLNSWQTDFNEYQNKLKELKSNNEQLLKSKLQFMIVAPINGTLLNVNGQELGGFVNAGTKLGEISPDTELLVECYVSPVDIGLLRVNNKINFQIDAYNYNQWGLATGEIIAIGKDIELVENRPVFKVRCKVNQKYLSLKNGFKGNLKKGMTLNANFQLVERSLYNLLYDKMDDWLNPSRNQIAKL